MSVLIKGMEMPKNCKECPFYWEQCGVDPEAVEEGYRTDDERHPDCPLGPVPEPGTILRVLKTERECVGRDCDRDCWKCDLSLERDEIVGVYDALIAMLDAADKEGEG